MHPQQNRDLNLVLTHTEGWLLSMALVILNWAVLSPGVHLTMSGDMFGCHKWERVAIGVTE